MRFDYLNTGGQAKTVDVKQTGLSKFITRITIFYLKSVLFFKILFDVLRLRKELQNYKYVYVSASKTFGLNLQFFDIISRLHYPEKVLWIFLPYELENKYLYQLFSHNMTFRVRYFDKRLIEFSASLYRLFLALLNVSNKSWPDYFVGDPRGMVRCCATDEVREMLENRDEKDYLYGFKTPLGQYRFLLNNKIGQPPRLRETVLEEIRQKITQKHPDFFSRKLICLVLREKGKNNYGMNGSIRAAGEISNYVSSVKYLSDKGYTVVGTGDTRHEFFKDIENYFALDDCGLDPDLVNIFAITNCCLFIGQNSGPFPLVTSAGGQFVSLDSAPFSYAPMGKKDIVLYKKLTYKGEEYSPVRVFREKPHLAFLAIDQDTDAVFSPNTEDEILETIREAVDILEGQKVLGPEEEETVRKWRDIAPKTSQFRYSSSRPASIHLRNYGQQLKDLPSPTDKT